MYNFDKVVDRRGTNCVKWDMLTKNFSEEDLVPMWVADMDFEVAKPICDRIIKRALHPVYGYALKDEEAFNLIKKHFNEKNNHTIEVEDIILSSGVVYSVASTILAFTKENDKIMFNSPAYHPFRSVTEESNRIVVDVPMKIENNRYVLDFEAMEEKVEDCKVFILCNPQNPTGRVFEREELTKLAQFCKKHNLLVISDEIHSDFIFDKKEFIPFVDIDEYTRNHTITCVSCTKTFNLAGLKVSAIFIKNKELRDHFNKTTSNLGLQSINIFGLEALKAAYEECEDWLEALVVYLQENRDFALEYLHTKLPQIKVLKSEGTYLLWLDLSFMDVEDPQKELREKVHVYFSNGDAFGEEYKKYIRVNLACPRSQVKEALDRLYNYFNQ